MHSTFLKIQHICSHPHTPHTQTDLGTDVRTLTRCEKRRKEKKSRMCADCEGVCGEVKRGVRGVRRESSENG